ncbi:MAG TPA: beta-propeller fold lactonase family protein [Longimicrobiales bacterium]|nr:beta-propeller fold lactonase family protein [Longimicrobiales bacterium]
MKRDIRSLVIGLASVGFAALTACSEQSPDPASPGALAVRGSVAAATGGGVYTMANGATANAILAFRRAADGSLTSLGAFPTGGRGSGGTVDPLQSQYSVVLDPGNRFLLAVNSGSDDVSVFRVGNDASLELTDRQSSGGDRPISLALDGDRLYVLNAGDNTVSGFRLNGSGRLNPIPHSTRSLAAGAAGASTIHFASNGDWLVVTERDANRLETFPVRPNGRLGEPVVTASSGATPFGFDVTSGGLPIVSEAAGAPPNGAVSSYRIAADGSLDVITGSLNSGGMASCWLLLTADDGIAFVVNSASSAIAAVRVGASGALTLLTATAGLTGAGSAPIDPDFSTGDQFLYVLEGATGNIARFNVGPNGTLTAQPDTPAGAPASGLQGMAAF